MATIGTLLEGSVVNSPVSSSLESHRALQDCPVLNGCCAALTRPAPYKAQSENQVNEDAYLVVQLADSSAVLAVADGVGGQAQGHEAAALAIRCLKDALMAESTNPSSLREPILNAIEQCNSRLIELGRSSATTLAVVELQGALMRPYHVGDSSIMVIGQRGRIKMQSISHSPIGFGIEAGLLEADAALNHAERHWISNLIGSTEMRIEIGAPLTLARFDTLVLCSDGLTDNLATEDIGESVRKGHLIACAETLNKQCEQAMKLDSAHPDDLTFLLYRQTTQLT